MAIALDNINSNNATASALTLIVSHTVTSNTNGILIVSAQWTGAVTTATAIYGVSVMTAVQAKIQTPSLIYNTQQFYLLTPPTGTANITITFTAPSSSAAESISLTGAAQTAPAVTAVTTGTSLAITNTITPLLAGSAVIDSAAMANATSTLTKGASQNQIANIVDATNARTGASSYQLGVATTSTTMSWTISGATTRAWAQQIVAISPFATAVTATGGTALMMGV